MKLKAYVQLEDTIAEDFETMVLSSDDVEDLVDQIATVREKAEEAGYVFSEELELQEEGNGSIYLVSNQPSGEATLVLKISGITSKVDQDTVRDHLTSN